MDRETAISLLSAYVSAQQANEALYNMSPDVTVHVDAFRNAVSDVGALTYSLRNVIIAAMVDKPNDS